MPDWIFPLLQWVLIPLLCGCVAAFTSPSSEARYAAAVVILSLAISVQNYIRAVAASWLIAGLISIFTWMSVLNSLDVLLHSRINYPEHMEWKKHNPSQDAPVLYNTTREKVELALNIPWNYRRVRTKWQIKNIPSFDPTEPGYVPNRWTFVAHRLLTCDENDCTRLHILLSEERQSLFPNQYWFSTEALSARLYFVISFMTSAWFSQRAIYNIASVIAVVSRISDPADWPPFQGALSETWTVRRLWGRTWHQTLRQLLSSNADFLVFSIFRPGTIWARYARYFVVFFLSGVIHTFLDEASGIPVESSRSLLFFTIQPIAFAVEDVAENLAKRYGVFTTDTPLRRLVGYIWVGVFCLWASPMWLYPVMRFLLANGQPVSIVNLRGVTQ
ncbi:hypothetical protein AOCH_006761 [Aspergillus ochraceoroseus]|uniref:Wax synthase domain-containing protein n=1 Tax=Aspergillus ochraceoroseus TaxID=138278 RepID=A0A0F8UME7_9EURO|nr:hypothetical protein AOCH_006761 [Aspergillus ochraceoroseus]